jgi:beta-N-acetylhexosaminidase
VNIDIGQLFMIGLEGPTLTGHEVQFMIENNIGGVTLFGRNLQTPEQIHKLCSDLYWLKDRMPSKMPPFIAIDMEGGRVHRLKAPFTQWPSLGKMAKHDSTTMAFSFSNLMGQELRALGVNLDFAPCVDVLTNPKNVLIGDRSIGSDPEVVAKLGSAVVRGYLKADIIACAKHFPGHGNTVIDSHEDLPVEEIDFATLRARELVPFAKTIRARLDMVMTAHILYKNIDPDFPATLSPIIVRDLLKKELRYKGLVVTDDLDMKALTKHYDRAEIPVRALQAGCDILLYCNEFDSPPIGLEAVRRALQDRAVPAPQVQESLHRVAELKRTTFAAREPMPFAEARAFFGKAEHAAFVGTI